MSRVFACACIALIVIPTAFPKSKKTSLPPAFQAAHTIYVEAAEGDRSNPSGSTEDRLAVAQVQLFLHQWNRYVLVSDRQKADLILTVRKGRIKDADLGQGLHAQSPQPTPVAPGLVPRPTLPPGAIDGSTTAAGDQVASPDRLRVYTWNQKGKLQGPLWGREMSGGLDGPSVHLLRQLKEAVELAYPLQPATQPAP